MTINRKKNTQEKMFTARTKKQIEAIQKNLQDEGWVVDDHPRAQGQFNTGNFYICLHRSVPVGFQDPADPYEIPLVDDDDEDEDDDRDDIAICPICGKTTDLTRDQFCKHLKFYLFDGEIERIGKMDKKLDDWIAHHPLFDEANFKDKNGNIRKCVEKFGLHQEIISGSGMACGPVSWEMELFYGE